MGLGLLEFMRVWPPAWLGRSPHGREVPENLEGLGLWALAFKGLLARLSEALAASACGRCQAHPRTTGKHIHDRRVTTRTTIANIVVAYALTLQSSTIAPHGLLVPRCDSRHGEDPPSSASLWT